MLQGLNFIFLFSLLLSGNTTFSQQEKGTAKAYSQAIAEYIKATRQKNESRLDTLFFGRHDDFPDIKLPSEIQGTKIRLITNAEAEIKRASADSFVFINMIDCSGKEGQIFKLIVFFVGREIRYKPQYDCIVDLKYNTERKEFELRSLKYEYPYPK